MQHIAIFATELLTDVAIANVPRIIFSGFMTQAFIQNEKSAVFECLQKLQDYCELLTPRKESENAPEKMLLAIYAQSIFFRNRKKLAILKEFTPQS